MRRCLGTHAGRGGAPLVAAAFLASGLLSGCGTQMPTTSPDADDVAAPSPTASPAPARADTLRVGFVPDELENSFGMFQGFRQLSGGEYANRIRLQNTVMATLYRLDARLGAVPDLADGPCTPPGDDPTVLRCRLVETTWHDGTPVTADDVAFVYQMWKRLGWGDLANLEEVRVVDPRTVDFALTQVDGSFVGTGLTSTAFTMQPRHAFEASYADFVARTKDLEATGLTKLADTIDGELGQDPPLCGTRLDEAGALLGTIGLTLYREDFVNENGTFDDCRYMELASAWIRATGDALTEGTLDAAVGPGLLSIDTQPIGAGPYRFVSEDAGGIHLEAWPGYHGGFAATRDLDFVPVRGHVAGVVEGTIDIDQGNDALDPAQLAEARSRGVPIAEYPMPGFIALSFNVRPGRLFADRDLRLALQQCVDLERDVDAATGGTGFAIHSPVLLDSWASEPDLPKPARDVAAARQRIEGAGWTRGDDGVYTKDGVRLEADMLVRAGAESRIKMADLIARQTRDCGMDLRTRPVEFEDMMAVTSQYPHNIPGTDQPFDLHIGGWGTAPDPSSALSGLASSQISDAEHPDAANFMGFADPIFDRLAGAALATYDQDERARLYREAQQELAAQLPVLYLWSGGSYDAVAPTVATVDGPLDLSAPNWAWQPERLVVEAP